MKCFLCDNEAKEGKKLCEDCLTCECGKPGENTVHGTICCWDCAQKLCRHCAEGWPKTNRFHARRKLESLLVIA